MYPDQLAHDLFPFIEGIKPSSSLCGMKQNDSEDIFTLNATLNTNKSCNNWHSLCADIFAYVIYMHNIKTYFAMIHRFIVNAIKTFYSTGKCYLMPEKDCL